VKFWRPGSRASEVAAVITLKINNQSHDVDVPGETPLLWVIRDVVGLTGTKFGCGAGLCGCCTVHLNGAATRSCVFPVSAVGEQSITTIEALGNGALTPLQQAWIDHQVPQCGYCQSGQLMAASALLAKTPHPTDAQIVETMTNICRCCTYNRIKTAIADAASKGAPQT
jgi:isoquinoline 1-oxidoreductase subunit alpha